jgi:hypothetical protein
MKNQDDIDSINPDTPAKEPIGHYHAMYMRRASDMSIAALLDQLEKLIEDAGDGDPGALPLARDVVSLIKERISRTPPS